MTAEQLRIALHKLLDDLSKDKSIEIGSYWYQEVNVLISVHYAKVVQP